jgi:uncharacterized protein DUF6603
MSTNTTTAEQIVAEFGRALLPLERIDSPEQIAGLLGELGWELPGADALGSDLQALVESVSAAREALYALEGASGPETVQLLIELVIAVEGIVTAIDGLLDQLDAELPDDVIADSGIREAFARRLIDYLIATHLRQTRPGLHGVLTVLGLIEQQLRDADPEHYQPEFILHIVHWDRIPLAITDPRALSEVAFGWGPDFDADGFVTRIEQLVRSVRLPGGIYDQDPVIAEALGRIEADPQELRVPLHQGGLWPDGYFETGVGVSPLIPGTPGGLGLALVPYFFGDWQADVDLGGGWHLTIAGGVDNGVGPAVIVRPPMELGLHADLLDGAADSRSFRFEATLSRESPDGEPMILFGSAGSSRIEFQRLVLSAAIDRSGDGETVDLGVDLDGLSVAIATGGADSFARALLPDLPLDASLDLPIGWSSTRGFHFNGAPRFDVSIPVFRSLGPITLETLHLAIGGGDGDTLDIDLTTDLSGGLTVFSASVERFGLATSLAFPGSGGNLGPVELGFGVVPPQRVTLALTTEAASGGGFIEIDTDIGRYSGALSLDFVSVGIDAIVVVDTQLPGDPDGWAFFASLAASFPGIPLGFGFTLNGVGGLIALNRTMDAEALAGALRSGVIDSLLFPDDPLGDSAELIAQIDDYFPLLDGNVVIGPVLEIGWGSPTLITAQLGVVLSLPDGVIAVLGSVEALLPTPDAPLITLHMDSLGVIDIGAGTFSLTASLYDSKLLGTIDLSGDMAMYLQVTGQPYFLLSVGGFHPGFEPPAIVPAAMHDLRRMRAAIDIASNVSISIEAYFAVTSNSLQFGAGVYAIASVEVWPTTYTAKGWFAFDVLLVFSPFKIVASMSAGVGIYAGNKELMGVQLSLQLEGPKPWYAVGNASFKFFGLKVEFALEVGSTAAGEPKPIAHPRVGVHEALATPSSWSETAPLDGLAAGITYAPATPEDDTVWVRPDHQLTVRQSVAPLNRTLEIIGQAVPASGEELLTVTAAGFGDGKAVDWELADDWFAPAQFEVLGKTDKLTRASYEEMTAGVTFGAPGVDVPAEGQTVKLTVVYEEETWEPDEQPWTLDAAVDSIAHSVHTGAAGAALRHLAVPTTTPRFTITPTTYTVVRSADGAPAADVLADAGLPTDGVTQHAALGARNAAIAEDGSRASRLVLVPRSAALELVS